MQNMYRDPLVIKVRLGNDIRRIPISNDDLTFTDLSLMLQRIFKSLSPSDNILIKYEDDEGDLITMLDDTDLNHATRNTRVLKLTLFVNEDVDATLDTQTVEGLRQELKSVCKAVDTLVKRLDQVAAQVGTSRKPSVQSNKASTTDLTAPSSTSTPSIMTGSSSLSKPVQPEKSQPESPSVSVDTFKDLDPIGSDRRTASPKPTPTLTGGSTASSKMNPASITGSSTTSLSSSSMNFSSGPSQPFLSGNDSQAPSSYQQPSTYQSSYQPSTSYTPVMTSSSGSTGYTSQPSVSATQPPPITGQLNSGPPSTYGQPQSGTSMSYNNSSYNSYPSSYSNPAPSSYSHQSTPPVSNYNPSSYSQTTSSNPGYGNLHSQLPNTSTAQYRPPQGYNGQS